MSPYWGHKVLNFVMAKLPFFVVNHITYSMHLGLRKKAMKKAASKTA